VSQTVQYLSLLDMPRRKIKNQKKPVPKDSPIKRDYTINLKKLVSGIQFKKKAPRAVREIKRFAQKVFFTKDVRIDVSLNQVIWSKGVRYIPNKVRVRLERKRNEDEEVKEMYTLCSYVPVTSFKELVTQQVVDSEDQLDK